MLLTRLKEYADERMGDQPPPLYESTPVAWLVVIDPDGRPLAPEPSSLFGEGAAPGKRGRDMVAPVVQRSSGTKPLLLADKGEYTFGRARDPKKQKRADERHAAYRELVDRCAAVTGEPAVWAVRRFYERGGAAQLYLGDGWDYGLKVAFVVQFGNGTRCNPVELPAVQSFWLSVNEPDPAVAGQCLVCGEHKPVLDRLQAKVKRIRGGRSSGTAIISANQAAFESYGLEKSRIAPTCRDCGEAFTRAVNHLIAGERTSLGVGNSTFIFWTRSETDEFDFGTLMREPDPATVKALVDSVRRGRRTAIANAAEFYAAALSASGGRAVVRDWIDTTVGNVMENVTRWFDLQQITDPRDDDPTGENPPPLSLFRLAVSTVRKPADLPATTVNALFNTALKGTPLPLEVAFQAVRRNRAEQHVRRERAALVKLVLLSRQAPPTKEKNYMVALEPNHPELAYHCGRLLAVIERVQYAALGRVNATVVDRYYGAASSTPAVVFGRLLRGAQPHLAKLEGGRRAGLQNLLMEVCGQITEFPKTLTLEQQALFSLGYYHQKAHDRSVAISRRTNQRSQTS